MNHKGQEQIYLDANATTPVISPILEQVTHTMTANFGNPSSTHLAGIAASDLLEKTRLLGKTVLGTTDGELLFTSGATEGIQTAVVSAISHYLKHTPHKLEEPAILYGATEHKAVPNTIKYWNSMLGLDAKILEIPVDHRGMLDHEFIAKNVSNAVMICTMAVNNETGVKQNLYELEKVIRVHNQSVAWLVDCVQALGKMELNMDAISIDYAPFSGHKLYAPKGIGFLYIRAGKPYIPFIAGGGQESGMRSGTENLPGIAGLCTLFSLLKSQSHIFNSIKKLQQHRKMLIDALLYTFPKITFHSRFEDSVPTTLNFSVDDFTGKEVIDLMDAAGIRVSGGSACSSGANSSFVLEAMGLSDWCCSNAIRLSFGPADSSVLIEKACHAIRTIKPFVQSEQPSNLLGLTQLYHQDAHSCLFVSKDRKAVVFSPLQSLLPKLQRLLKNNRLNEVTFLIDDLADRSNDLIRNIKHTFGQSVDIVTEEQFVQDACHQSGEGWGLTLQTTGGKKSFIFSVANDNTRKRVFVTQTMADTDTSTYRLFYASGVADEGTPLCSKMTSLSGLNFEATSVEYDEPADQQAANSWIDNHNAFVLDVREEGEHFLSQGQIPEKLHKGLEKRVINIPLGRLANAYIDGRLSDDLSYLVVCRSGNRSKLAVEILLSLGIKRVANLSKGLARL
ncbi:aminotransferase class V-fold PLP-dependent enzyme [Pseudoalteromonas luteoviolacea]|uniref:cysteine desulfurase n=1 Tax=Pseudoalteromonas luteoviolacea S4054 TaxID=1129367 RepID=A0A0F6AI65_9GAMM|nr:aminotransferase class V-fold PLP-dependent enzyme [Pseudoalteromonas luteoviolacea]AOT07916.1 hypothetical protein S4054249_08700 [Pseudoalteromonas luteoviolacea]AOT12832.1 hypothetical protein S40542_08700 [Pseudoalteromonas luteoviolacea]AOT17745.1 hypothetical protein S4054_08695 [Pseudoalteromonas luteoviolacea]KKE85843.1 hypothetical protein N479_00285 [Pseudoalteromonas luteoviolacea S4054]KZN74721.1 hypothetical protein N481_08665 [Pseudoalteromonas luteoviolacea S4047-1]